MTSKSDAPPWMYLCSAYLSRVLNAGFSAKPRSAKSSTSVLGGRISIRPWSLMAAPESTSRRKSATLPKPIEELKNLVYGCTPMESQERVPLLKKPVFWAAVVFVVFVVLNIIFLGGHKS